MIAAPRAEFVAPPLRARAIAGFLGLSADLGSLVLVLIIVAGVAFVALLCYTVRKCWYEQWNHKRRVRRAINSSLSTSMVWFG